MTLECLSASPAPESYQESINYLFGLQRFGIKFGLENMKRMLRAFGNPHQKLKTVHIAGSNGKGSVAAFVAKIFRKAGYGVGLYTSPHLSDFSERIRINGEPISAGEVVHLTRVIREKQYEVAKEEGALESPTSVTNMTFFEFTTLMAFLFFFKKKVDLAVVEVGMGGRLDATNVLYPLVSVITTVSKDHQQYLGNTFKEISREKAGIIKPKGILITAVRQPRVLAQIRAQCRAMESVMYRIGKDIRITRTGGGTFDYQGILASYQGLTMEMKGDHQLVNAALAIGIAELLSQQGYNVNENTIRAGLKETKWPGRLELVNRNPRVLLDGAHNLEAIRRLGKELATNFSYRRLFLVIGIMEDKAIRPILKELLPLGHHVVFTRPKGDRSASPAFLLQCAGRLTAKAEVVEEVKQAVQKAMGLAKGHDLICVTGSLYTVGEARQLFSPRVEI